MSCLGLEYFCFEGDGLWTPPTRNSSRSPRRRSRKIGLIAAEDVVDACVVRQPRPIRSMTTPIASNVATIRRDLEPSFPTLHLVGRNGMHKYNNQDHAMMTAMLTAATSLPARRITTSGTSTRMRNITRPASPAPSMRCRASASCRAARPRPASPDAAAMIR